MSDETTTLPPMVKLEDVEWRIDSEAYKRGNEYTCRWVPYLDASKVARLMDEWVGPGRWRIDGYFVPDWTDQGLMCKISVRFGDEWVPRMDIGDRMKGIHEAKGSVSDAFKRTACRAWGAGRNVYELPTLYAPCRVKFDNNGNPVGKKNQHGRLQIQAMGSDRDTERALLNQLREQGFDNPTVRVSMVTEGADQFGESPAGVVVPADPDPDEEPVVEKRTRRKSSKPAGTAATQESKGVGDAEATVTPLRTADTPEAVREAVSAPTPGGVSLPELLSQFSSVPRPMMDELRDQGLWPVGKVESPEHKALAAEIINKYLEKGSNG